MSDESSGGASPSAVAAALAAAGSDRPPRVGRVGRKGQDHARHLSDEPERDLHGLNQKSNRWPLDATRAERGGGVARSASRACGAVGLVEGYGRVAKYRHYLYEWLGVDKVELAVMTELLLRGDQTVGEFRGRAARMEPIADLAALRPLLDSLKAKGLVVALTPEGRGHVVTHALYRPREMEALKAKYQGGGAAGFGRR